MAYQNPFIPGASLRIVSIEDGGVWIRGNIYTVVWYYHNWRIFDEISETYQYRLAPVFDNTGSVYSTISLPATPIFSTSSVADSYVVVTLQDNDGLRREDFSPTDYTDLAMNTDITQGGSFDFTNLGGESGGDLYSKYLVTSTFTVAADAIPGEYILSYMGVYKDHAPNPDPVIETQRVYYPITILEPGESLPAIFPPPRPDDYDPDDYYDPNGGGDGTGGFTSNPTDLTTLGGGRYNQQLVVLGNKKIYFGGLS